MIWLDLFLQLFVHALAWCCALVATVVIVAILGKAYAAGIDRLSRPRALKAGRSPFTGGLS